MTKQVVYDKEFKSGAVRLVEEEGYTFREAADRLGVKYWTLRGWVYAHRAKDPTAQGAEKRVESAELKKLRQDNRRLQMEVEILKKAAAYFAKESL